MITRNAFVLYFAAAVSLCAAATANALTITGEFTKFLGIMGGGQCTTLINGSTVCPFGDCTQTAMGRAFGFYLDSWEPTIEAIVAA